MTQTFYKIYVLYQHEWWYLRWLCTMSLYERSIYTNNQFNQLKFCNIKVLHFTLLYFIILVSFLKTNITQKSLKMKLRTSLVIGWYLTLNNLQPHLYCKIPPPILYFKTNIFSEWTCKLGSMQCKNCPFCFLMYFFFSFFYYLLFKLE